MAPFVEGHMGVLPSKGQLETYHEEVGQVLVIGLGLGRKEKLSGRMGDKQRERKPRCVGFEAFRRKVACPFTLARLVWTSLNI